MKTMKNWRNIFVMCAAILSLTSCDSDEPKYADLEAHEKTVQLNEQYGPIIVGTWHYENISDTQRYFERLTFQTDGTLTGFEGFYFKDKDGWITFLRGDQEPSF